MEECDAHYLVQIRRVWAVLRSWHLRHLLEMRETRNARGNSSLLTDGAVSNEAAVIDLCARHAPTARVFALGLGADVNAPLVRRVARAAHGAAECISPGERIEPKVRRMFDRLRGPACKRVQVDWATRQWNRPRRSGPLVFRWGQPDGVWPSARRDTRPGGAARRRADLGDPSRSGAARDRWAHPLPCGRATASATWRKLTGHHDGAVTRPTPGQPCARAARRAWTALRAAVECHELCGC